MKNNKLMKVGMTTLILLWATTSWAVPPHSQVLGLLEGRHWQLDPGAFRRLGAGTAQVLQELADNDSLTNYLRFRALEALTAFPKDQTAAFLEAFSQRTEPALARRGVEALARGFGQTHPQHVQRTAAASAGTTRSQGSPATQDQYERLKKIYKTLKKSIIPVPEITS